MDASDPNAALAENGFLPAFANEENKKLNAAILDLRKHLEELTGHIEQNQDSISVMSEHLKNVQQELTYTESRVEANKKEIETENHLKQLADREFGRVKKDVDKLAKERLELQARAKTISYMLSYELPSHDMLWLRHYGGAAEEAAGACTFVWLRNAASKALWLLSTHPAFFNGFNARRRRPVDLLCNGRK